MKFFSQVMTTVALVATGVAALEDGIRLSEIYGGPHGERYSDLDLTSAGQAVHAINIRTGERVNRVELDVTDLEGSRTTLHHGGRGGNFQTLTLGENEYVKCIEAHSGEYHSHTRIRYIKFTTSLGNTISGGTPTTKIGKDCAPEGYQLGGFMGTSGKELDSVGAIWTSIEPVE